jgi:biotin operon repressor
MVAIASQPSKRRAEANPIHQAPNISSHSTQVVLKFILAWYKTSGFCADMDSRTYQNIAANASLIAQYAQLSGRLKDTLKVLSFGKKEVSQAIEVLETGPAMLWNPALYRAYQIYNLLLKSPNQSLESLAVKLEVSPSTVQQTINALKAGSVSIPSQTVKTYSVRGGDGIGAARANEKRTNDERVDEAIAVVEAAVSKLCQVHDWDTLPVRQKIKLLQAETKTARGTAISTQTLYREWIRDLW